LFVGLLYSPTRPPSRSIRLDRIQVAFGLRALGRELEELPSICASFDGGLLFGRLVLWRQALALDLCLGGFLDLNLCSAPLCAPSAARRFLRCRGSM
jgi:hypothetical protein